MCAWNTHGNVPCNHYNPISVYCRSVWRVCALHACALSVFCGYTLSVRRMAWPLCSLNVDRRLSSSQFCTSVRCALWSEVTGLCVSARVTCLPVSPRAAAGRRAGARRRRTASTGTHTPQSQTSTARGPRSRRASGTGMFCPPPHPLLRTMHVASRQSHEHGLGAG